MVAQIPDTNDKTKRISLIDAILIVSGGVLGCAVGRGLALYHIANSRMLSAGASRENLTGSLVLGGILLGWVIGCVVVHRLLRLLHRRDTRVPPPPD